MGIKDFFAIIKIRYVINDLCKDSCTDTADILYIRILRWKSQRFWKDILYQIILAIIPANLINH